MRLHQSPGAVAAMVVQPGERNAYDQQWIQQQLWQAHGVDMVRLTLAQIGREGQLDSQGQLVVGGRVVSVAYFRCDLGAGLGQAGRLVCLGACAAAAACSRLCTRLQVLQQRPDPAPLCCSPPPRAGYTPTDYPSELEWQARALVERSAAAKCPTAAYQLAGERGLSAGPTLPGLHPV